MDFRRLPGRRLARLEDAGAALPFLSFGGNVGRWPPKGRLDGGPSGRYALYVIEVAWLRSWRCEKSDELLQVASTVLYQVYVATG